MLFYDYINLHRQSPGARKCLFCDSVASLTYNAGYIVYCNSGCGLGLHFSGYSLYLITTSYLEEFSNYLVNNVLEFSRNYSKITQLGKNIDYKFVTPTCFRQEISRTNHIFDEDYFDLSIFYRHYLNKDLA